jgi:hypothetical protein
LKKRIWNADAEIGIRRTLECKNGENWQEIYIYIHTGINVNKKGKVILFDSINRNRVSTYINSLYFFLFYSLNIRLVIYFCFLNDYFNTMDPLYSNSKIVYLT